MSDSGVKASIARWIAPEIRALTAYHVPPADGRIKLDAMENPYQLPQDLKKEWLSVVESVEINRYPDPQCVQLKNQLHTMFDIAANREIMIGNGSDELIQIIMMLMGGKGRVVLAPTPTFSMYGIISVATGSQFVGVPLGEDFNLERRSLLEAIARHDPAVVFLAYPNNPTGNRFEESIMEEVFESAKGLVVVDEAYFSFCRRSFVDRLQRYPNLLILRTMSKSGMAGLRVGLLIGHPEWIAELEKLRLPYNIDSLTQASAMFYLKHYAILNRQADIILRNREELYRRMASIAGLTVFSSEANFILFRVARRADRLFCELQERGILIKNLHLPGSPLENCFRVTVGTHEENDAFIAAIESVLQT